MKSDGSYYRPQTKFAKERCLSFCPGGACVVALGGMCGCLGGMYGCLGGHAWLLGMRHIICTDNEIGWLLIEGGILAVTSRGIMQISKGNQRTECDIRCGNQMGNLLPKFRSLQGDGFFCQ